MLKRKRPRVKAPKGPAVPWAYNGRNELTGARRADKRRDKPFRCALCARSVIACQGEKRKPYFAHAAETSCRGGGSGSGESDVHLMCKRLLMEWAKRPDARWMCAAPACGAVYPLLGADEALLRSEDEKRLVDAPLIPDVTLWTTRRRIALEALHTHAVTEDKRDSYEELGIPCLELRAAAVGRVLEAAAKAGEAGMPPLPARARSVFRCPPCDARAAEARAQAERAAAVDALRASNEVLHARLLAEAAAAAAVAAAEASRAAAEAERAAVAAKASAAASAAEKQAKRNAAQALADAAARAVAMRAELERRAAAAAACGGRCFEWSRAGCGSCVCAPCRKCEAPCPQYARDAHGGCCSARCVCVTFFRVDFDRRDGARACGARFDWSEKAWYTESPAAEARMRAAGFGPLRIQRR